jgi:RIO-like serine/threonine protein kinase
MAAILKSFDVPLPPDLLAELRRVIDNKIHESTAHCAADIGVGKSSLIRAAAGLPCRPATIKVIAMGLAKFRSEGAAA